MSEDFQPVSEAVGGPRFVHSDIPLDTAPVWRVVTGAENHNFNCWPVEVDDPLPPLPEGFGGFS